MYLNALCVFEEIVAKYLLSLKVPLFIYNSLINDALRRFISYVTKKCFCTEDAVRFHSALRESSYCTIQGVAFPCSCFHDKIETHCKTGVVTVHMLPL